MTTLSWIIGGSTYELDDTSATYFLNNVATGLNAGCVMVGHDGFGIPDHHLLEERGPLQNGVTYRGYRLDPRTIMIGIMVYGSDISDYYSKRAYLNNIFKPTNSLCNLRWINGSTRRQIDAINVAGLEWDSGGRNYLFHKAVITLRCPDPRWYDPTVNTVNFNLGGGSDTFEVPFAVPFTVGVSTLNTIQSIIYSGNIKSYPTIRITGPITNPVITNVETGLKLDFTGTTIAAGTTYVITLGYADNTVKTSTGTNKIADLTTDSDLVEFCIDPEFGGGTNTIRVTGTSIDGATNVRIIYHDYYIGV